MLTFQWTYHPGISRSAVMRFLSAIQGDTNFTSVNFTCICSLKTKMTHQLSAQSNKLTFVCILSQLALNGKGVLLRNLL